MSRRASRTRHRRVSPTARRPARSGRTAAVRGHPWRPSYGRPSFGIQIVGLPTNMDYVSDLHVPQHPVRVVTASSLFDGHDASINIMRRILQSQGAEVIHLGHNRSVEEVLVAALQEDVQGVAVSSYQGGHVEYFKYLVDQLRARGAGHVKVYGGGGGTIVPREVKELEGYGVA